jgi:hypothetical protein
MNKGETRQVETRTRLIRNVEITSASGAAPGMEISIFALDSNCPPLTGPKVSLNQTYGMSLDSGDYQYDYFYLNTGSTLEVSLEQGTGATNMYLLQGMYVLDRAMDDNDDSSFRSLSIMQKFVGSNSQGSLQITVSKSATYIAVYENASSSISKASVSIHGVLTSYNLKGHSPIPSSWCDGPTCTVTRRGHPCILVQANQQEVGVTIVAERRWGAILSLALLLPLLLGFICVYVRSARESYTEDERPPPSTPYNTPSSFSPASQHYMAVAQAEVVPSAPMEDNLPFATAVPVEK